MILPSTLNKYLSQERERGLLWALAGMGKSLHKLAAIAVLAALLCPSAWAQAQPDHVAAYWLWSGLTDSDIPADPNATIYIYQGNLSVRGGETQYQHKGIFPYPIDRSHVQIVFRLLPGSPPDAANVAAIYTQAVDEWKHHGVKIEGLQLDSDWPTGKLEAYAAYLERLRTFLPPGQLLGVTGLGDWIVHGDPAALKRIARNSGGIVFQLYLGHKSLLFAADYANKLGHADFPFRIGLLRTPEQQELIARVDKNPYYRGVILFVQKKVVAK